jgi:magnesium transporter
MSKVRPRSIGVYTMSTEYGSVDHILTLQQSLAHYERMLSESHPMYLQNLNMDLLRARSKRDYGMFVLAVVTVVVVPPSVVIGMCTL